MTISNRRNFVLGVATAAATASLSAAAQTPNPVQTFAKLPSLDPVKMATDLSYWSAV
jgi:hypothetical protein